MDAELNERIGEFLDRMALDKFGPEFDMPAIGEAKKYVSKIVNGLGCPVSEDQIEAWFDGFYDGYRLAKGLSY